MIILQKKIVMLVISEDKVSPERITHNTGTSFQRQIARRTSKNSINSLVLYWFTKWGIWNINILCWIHHLFTSKHYMQQKNLLRIFFKFINFFLLPLKGFKNIEFDGEVSGIIFVKLIRHLSLFYQKSSTLYVIWNGLLFDISWARFLNKYRIVSKKKRLTIIDYGVTVVAGN